MEITRHWTATTVIVYNGRVLLHYHHKLKLWLPPGGHIDRDELPENAALREVKEETGLDIEFYQPQKIEVFGDAVQLLSPFCILLEDINPYHQHIDLIYLARATHGHIIPEINGAHEFRWVTLEDCTILKIPENVTWLVRKALEVLG